MPATEKYTSNG